MTLANVSVIITCHNEGPFIRQTLESALSQTAASAIRDICIVDDGSDDATRTVLRDLECGDQRVKVLFQDNTGVAAARNRAAANAAGEWLAMLDGDDYWLPERLARQLAAASRFGERLALVYSDYFVVEHQSLHVRPAMTRICCRSYQPDMPAAAKRFFVHDGPIMPSTVLVRRSVFEELNGFNPLYRRAEEPELWLRLLMLYDVVHVPEPLVVRRLHPSSLGANGYEMYAAFLHLTDDFIDRFPQFRGLRPKRVARRQTKFGQWLADTGRRRDAARYYVHGIRSDPTYLTPYFHLIILALPKRVHTGIVTVCRGGAAAARRMVPSRLSWRI